MKFSEKYGYIPAKVIQVECMDEVLRKRLINLIRNTIDSYEIDSQYVIKSYLVDKFGYPAYIGVNIDIQFINLLDQSKVKWYVLYDVIDSLTKLMATINFYNTEFAYSINRVLEEEKAGYRIVNEEIAPITNPNEIAAIEQAATTKFNSVNTHIAKAISLYANRDKPDYENSIKESISAVESMCCIITDLTGANATLGKALKQLEDHNVIIHSAMKEAFTKLYGYTSDQDGIRHGGIDFTNAPEEDAKYMLIACSAFVNYLVEKNSKFE